MPCLRTGHPTRPILWFQHGLLCLLATTVFCAGQAGPTVVLPAATTPASPTPTEDAVQKLRHGDYAEAATAAKKAVSDSYPTEALLRVEAEALLAQGKYSEVYNLLKSNVAYSGASIRLSLLFRQACLYIGRENEAQATLRDINTTLALLAQRQQYSQTPTPLPPTLLADSGEAALLQNQDPKQLLQQFFALGQQSTPPVRDAFLAAGQLGLDKHDYRLASKSFGDGLKAFPGDPDMLFGLAAAFRPDDKEQFANYAKQALAANPRHIPTLLMLAENLIDAESYDKARDALQKILAINPHEQGALALQAVIAYLHNQPGQGDAYRTQALTTWKNNPRVDYLIGQKLSQNYRFELGAKFQRLALENDPKFTPASVQLAQDLLRLGREDEGWKLADQAHKDDGYDVEAFNLVTLRDELAQYTTIAKDNFTISMEPTEARVYGSHVLELLNKVRAAMTKKYGLDLTTPTLVEIFPDSADFSVRTFGMPDIGEYLGVTFGSVVTINSPGTHDSNWEDVLWHEFTHVVTLTLTHNQMPRWLSEGISVYEEHQAKPEWGQLMSPDDYERIMAEKMQPISNMSAAFLQAKDMGDTQFAYFESSLIVQYLQEKYGMEKMKSLLQALGQGEEMNDVLAKNFAPVAQLDEDFVKYAKEQALNFAKGWVFSQPDKKVKLGATALSGAALATPALVAAVDPHDFYSRMQQITALMDKEEWAKVRDQIAEINATGLYLPGAENLYLLLADACAKLKDIAGEKAALTYVAEHEGDSLVAISRLLEIAQEAKDWAEVARWSQAALAIHPMSVTGWRGLFDASEQLHDNAHGVEAGLALLELQPPDLASVNYRVAKMMQPADTESARRHVLQALEDAPRFRAAYELLTVLPLVPEKAPAVSNANPAPATP